LVPLRRNNSFEVVVGEKDYSDYYVIIEANRLNSYFVHIVPKPTYELFKKMQNSIKNQMLGFTVLAGKHKEKDVRVSCFGVECGLLGKSLF
jgi:hypothetical protein